jgi:hypothetical protein
MFMPRLRLLLFASLSVNAFMGVLGWQRSGVGGHEEEAKEEAVVPASTENWQALVDRATDEDFVGRLRQEGFPARVIRRLVTLRVEDRHAERLRVLRAEVREDPYSLESPFVDPRKRESLAAIRALGREMKKEIRGLLGTGAFHLPGDYSYDHRERFFGDLPDARIAAIEAVNTDYLELAEEVRENAYGFRFPDDLEKLKLLERERRADLARLLTPSELEHYERRFSWSAYAVIEALIGFDATEAEYHAMYEAQRAFDERYGMQHVSREEEELRLAARPELLAAWEVALGPVRFEEFQLKTDRRFGALLWWVELNGLSKERAVDLVRIVRDLDGRKRVLMVDDDLASDERAARLEALVVEAQSRFAVLVGVDKLGAFMEEVGSELSTPTPPLPEIRR